MRHTFTFLMVSLLAVGGLTPNESARAQVPSAEEEQQLLRQIEAVEAEQEAARKSAAQEAKRKAQAEAERKRKVEEARLAAEAEAKRQAQAEAESQRKVEAARLAAEAEAKRQEEAARLAAEAQKRQAEQAKVVAVAGEFVDIPGGTFSMGCSPGDGDCAGDERPTHTVTVKPFRMGKYEVTFAQWDACVAEGACTQKPSDEGWGRGNHPVINVSWDDARQFVAWASKKTGKTIRLPTEAEWEYACRGGAQDKYCGGSNVDAVAWYSANSGIQTHPVGQKQANGFGLHDMSGNVWEWTQDCWNGSYNGAPTDGSAWTSGKCSQRVYRGGWWLFFPGGVRSSLRDKNTTDARAGLSGFRLVQDLD